MGPARERALTEDCAVLPEDLRVGMMVEVPAVADGRVDVAVCGEAASDELAIPVLVRKLVLAMLSATSV